MLSVIKKKEALGEIFKDTDGLIEVYSLPDFSLEHRDATFIAYGKFIEPTPLLYRLLKIGWVDLKLYVTDKPFAPMLEGKRIIWRDGIWHL